MAHWYVYRGIDEVPLGPWSTEAVADAILAGTLDPAVWVGAPGGTKWLRASDVPVIARRLEGQPTRRSPQSAAAARAPDTHRTPPPAAPPPGVQPVEIRVAPSPRVPAAADAFYGGGDTLESPGNERGRR